MHGSRTSAALFVVQVFGLGALVRSGVVGDSAVSAARVADALLVTGAKKSFLREVSTSVLLALLDAASDEALPAVVNNSRHLQVGGVHFKLGLGFRDSRYL